MTYYYYKGIRLLGFLSVILGSCLFGVCGSILWKYRLVLVDFLCDSLPLDFLQMDSSQDKVTSLQHSNFNFNCFSSNYTRFSELEMMLSWNSIIVLNLSILQVISAAFLLPVETDEEASHRAKYWTILQILLISSYICLKSQFHYLDMLSDFNLIQISDISFNASTKYINAFFFALEMNIVLGGLSLIITLFSTLFRDTQESKIEMEKIKPKPSFIA